MVRIEVAVVEVAEVEAVEEWTTQRMKKLTIPQVLTVQPPFARQMPQ
jgi:hypothetical protein